MIRSIALMFALLAVAPLARADDEPEAGGRSECANAYERAQEDRSSRHFVAARQKFQICTQSSCPAFMQSDCSKWLDELATAMPTMVFAVRINGEDMSDARVFVDGNLLVEQLDGTAVAVDPGLHEFIFEHMGSNARAKRNLLVREGEKNRLVTVELMSANDSPRSTGTDSKKGQRSETKLQPGEVLPYALFGVGGIGVLGFTVFGLVGNSQMAELEDSCAPRCSNEEVNSVRVKWLIADVSLGVGVVSLATATYLLLNERNASETQQQAKRSIPVDVHSLPGGGYASFGAEF